MIFTDRFIKVTVVRFSELQEKNFDNPVIEKVSGRVDPYQISHYEETTMNDIDHDCTLIYFRNGHCMTVDYPMTSFEVLLNRHYQLNQQTES